jgi:RimJ/RimL family protein N-acetyltransferase
LEQRTPAIIQLREVTDADLATLFEQQLDPIACQMAAFPSRDRQAFMAHWARIMSDPTKLTRAILFDGQVAGNIGSWEQAGEREVGYWIGREYWGKGIASAALAAFLDIVQARPLYAFVAKHNRGSLRVLEKNGFAVIGEVIDPPDASGEAAEGYLLKLGAEEREP